MTISLSKKIQSYKGIVKPLSIHKHGVQLHNKLNEHSPGISMLHINRKANMDNVIYKDNEVIISNCTILRNYFAPRSPNALNETALVVKLGSNIYSWDESIDTIRNWHAHTSDKPVVLNNYNIKLYNMQQQYIHNTADFVLHTYYIFSRLMNYEPLNNMINSFEKTNASDNILQFIYLLNDYINLPTKNIIFDNCILRGVPLHDHIPGNNSSINITNSVYIPDINIDYKNHNLNKTVNVAKKNTLKIDCLRELELLKVFMNKQLNIDKSFIDKHFAENKNYVYQYSRDNNKLIDYLEFDKPRIQDIYSCNNADEVIDFLFTRYIDIFDTYELSSGNKKCHLIVRKKETTEYSDKIFGLFGVQHFSFALFENDIELPTPDSTTDFINHHSYRKSITGTIPVLDRQVEDVALDTINSGIIYPMMLSKASLYSSSISINCNVYNDELISSLQAPIARILRPYGYNFRKRKRRDKYNVLTIDKTGYSNVSRDIEFISTRIGMPWH